MKKISKLGKTKVPKKPNQKEKRKEKKKKEKRFFLAETVFNFFKKNPQQNSTAVSGKVAQKERKLCQSVYRH